jgi:hypothetical protein
MEAVSASEVLVNIYMKRYSFTSQKTALFIMTAIGDSNLKYQNTTIPPEDGGSTILINVGKSLPDYTASHHRQEDCA